MPVALKLVIKGPAAATKIGGLEVQVTFTNTGGSTSGRVTFQLKNMIDNDLISPTAGAGEDVNVPSGESSKNFNLGEFFSTPRTGPYHLQAHFNGEKSNDLMVKLLL
eukprot:TRINITY_DN222_c0_g1_i1.p1 TRINITY_DN222_c0_g1~~TRINITY_DN222_c0_g1_i1.p1  ORF type:complete len:107 (-),score=35.23 TRINITY_DN222_c0_g1_i1:112-432(-)